MFLSVHWRVSNIWLFYNMLTRKVDNDEIDSGNEHVVMHEYNSKYFIPFILQVDNVYVCGIHLGILFLRLTFSIQL